MKEKEKKAEEKKPKRWGFIKRIAEITEDNNTTLTNVESVCGISRSTLTKAYKEQRPISTSTLEQFVENMHKITIGRKVNPNWLLTGKGVKYDNAYRFTAQGHVLQENTDQQEFNEMLKTALLNDEIVKELKDAISQI